MPPLPISSQTIDLDRLRQSYLSLIASTEVNRLLEDITTCTLSRENVAPGSWENIPPKGGVELFPFLAVQTRRHQLDISGTLFPNQEDASTGTLYHLIRLQLGDETTYFKLSTSQSLFCCRLFIADLSAFSLDYHGSMP